MITALSLEVSVTIRKLFARCAGLRQ